MATITRRDLLCSLSALGVIGAPVRAARRQDSGTTLRARTLNHFGIAVADPKRSIEFYQGLFGLPIQARDAATTILRVGEGPQFLSIAPAAAGAAPSISHYCVGIDGFNVDRVIATLVQHGVERATRVAAMKVVASKRQERDDVMFGDPDGIVCQIEDVSYCGGSGPLGDKCTVAESAAKGLITLSDISHLTIFSTDAARSNKFYQDLFGFSIRSYQGPTAPTLAVGPTTQFLMFTGGGAVRAGAAPRPASINHACFSLAGFKPDEVTKKLESFGLKPREAQGPVGPLRHYVTMRMENRGGAPGGTPELYFTDPDGLLMQLQDTSYCGGGGFLGNECPKV